MESVVTLGGDSDLRARPPAFRGGRAPPNYCWLLCALGWLPCDKRIVTKQNLFSDCPGIGHGDGGDVVRLHLLLEGQIGREVFSEVAGQ